MASLYELSENYTQLFDRFDSINDYEFEKDERGRCVDDDGMVIDPEAVKTEWLEAWFDTLSGIEEEFDIKAENVAVYIKHLISDVKDMKEERSKLSERIKAKERKAEQLKKYLLDNMRLIGVNKIDRPRACLTVRKNAASLVVDDEDKFISMLQHIGRDDLLRYAKPEIRKADIKNLMKLGETFDGASLESGFSMTIK